MHEGLQQKSALVLILSALKFSTGVPIIKGLSLLLSVAKK